MSTTKDFTKADEARIFRDAKRQEGLAASIFTFGKDRYRVKVWEEWANNPLGAQWRLSDSASQLSQDIADLNKVKELIANPDFGSDIEDVVFVAKKLNKERWFNNPDEVIDFFDGNCYDKKELAKIQDMVDTALKEYDEEWNDKSEVTA